MFAYLFFCRQIDLLLLKISVFVQRIWTEVFLTVLFSFLKQQNHGLFPELQPYHCVEPRSSPVEQPIELSHRIN